MIDYKKLSAGAAIFAVVLLAGSFTVNAAFSGQQGGQFGQGGRGMENRDFKADPERHQAVEDAMDNHDYTAWVEAMGDRGNLSEVVTEDNFDQFIQIHELRENGQNDEAMALAKELGLQKMNGKFKGHGGHMGFEDKNGDGLCDNLDIEDQQ